MRSRLIVYLKKNPAILSCVWKMSQFALRVIGFFIPTKDKVIIFSSFGGRKFDDSPKAIYDQICGDPFFNDWEITWAFTDPSKWSLTRGRSVKIDTPSFFFALLRSKVWVSNSGMTRGIRVNRKNAIRIETWHGTPLKKIGGEENQNSMVTSTQKRKRERKKVDTETIRCAQSVYDREIFQRIFHAAQQSFLMCDLPRNDSLFQYTSNEIQIIKSKLGLKSGKKVILYTPTYREYLIDEHNDTFIAPPMDLQKWQRELGNEYILLIRAHYAVSKALNIRENDFVKDVSDYESLNDLYIISDIMISDYSSTFIDYAILDRPMLCFAYDLEEYKEKRGLYIDLEKELPCSVDKDEDKIINHLRELDYKEAAARTKEFHMKYAPHAGHASQSVVAAIKERLS